MGYYYFGDDIGPDPIRVVLKAFCGGKAPPDYVMGYSCGNLGDAQHEELIEWLHNNVKIYWTIGIAHVEAADRLVQEAVDNANIPPPEYWDEETIEAWKKKKRSIRKAKQRRKAQKESRGKSKRKKR